MNCVRADPCSSEALGCTSRICCTLCYVAQCMCVSFAVCAAAAQEQHALPWSQQRGAHKHTSTLRACGVAVDSLSAHPASHTQVQTTRSDNQTSSNPSWSLASEHGSCLAWMRMVRPGRAARRQREVVIKCLMLTNWKIVCRLRCRLTYRQYR